MDWLVCRAFIESVKTGTNPPIDVYDAATWLAVGALSARSIREERTVDFPDFTHGLWMRREPALKRKYGLEEVVEDPTVPIFPTPLEKHEADENGLQ